MAKLRAKDEWFKKREVPNQTMQTASGVFSKILVSEMRR
jgi:hypothetical protein